MNRLMSNVCDNASRSDATSPFFIDNASSRALTALS